MSDQLHNKHSLIDERRLLRNNPTKEERILWEHIRNKMLGSKFRRQHRIGDYIVDFYCPRNKLVIELDGAQHFTHQGKLIDKERDRTLSDWGSRILRFKNSEVTRDIKSVLNKIQEHL